MAAFKPDNIAFKSSSLDKLTDDPRDHKRLNSRTPLLRNSENFTAVSE